MARFWADVAQISRQSRNHTCHNYLILLLILAKRARSGTCSRQSLQTGESWRILNSRQPEQVAIRVVATANHGNLWAELSITRHRTTHSKNVHSVGPAFLQFFCAPMLAEASGQRLSDCCAPLQTVRPTSDADDSPNGVVGVVNSIICGFEGVGLTSAFSPKGRCCDGHYRRSQRSQEATQDANRIMNRTQETAQ